MHGETPPRLRRDVERLTERKMNHPTTHGVPEEDQESDAITLGEKIG
jgi:hypothetical protein